MAPFYTVMDRVKRLLDASPPPDSPEYALFELLLAVTRAPTDQAARVRATARCFEVSPLEGEPGRAHAPPARKVQLPN
ncbi:MAG: hypothetical protein ABTD50_18385 [Polyangiaceae bacterium]